MNDEGATYAVSEIPGAPDPISASEPAASGEFRFDVLLIGIVVVGAIVASNIWLRIRAERDDSD